MTPTKSSEAANDLGISFLGGEWSACERAVLAAWKSVQRQWDKADAIAEQFPTTEDLMRLPLHYGPISDKLHREHIAQLVIVGSAKEGLINALSVYVAELQKKVTQSDSGSTSQE